jgi:hypothetical protein
MGSALWSKFFVVAQEENAEELAKAQERIGAITDLLSRPAFHSEIVSWLEGKARDCRVTPGPHENMLYQAGYRDGIESVLDHIRLLIQTAKEN